MVNYWIFVSVPYTDFNTGSIYETCKRRGLLTNWPLGKKTPYRKELSENDKILLYQGGEKGKRIVGSAELASGLIQHERGIFDSVRIRNFELWEKTVEIKKIIKNLSFVRNKMRWGVYFQGGIVRISEKDYKEILRTRI